jgi:hypothetical protein
MFFHSRHIRKFQFYPKAFEPARRHHGQDPEVVPTRRRFAKLATINLFILQTLFLLLFAYIYGALYHLTIRVNRLSVVFVDYDGGVIGQAVRQAYAGMQSPGFPSLIEQTPQEFGDPQALRDGVCHTDFWAALFIQKGASDSYAAALGGGMAASSYNKTAVMAYIWDQVRFGPIMDSALISNLVLLSDSAKVALLPLHASSISATDINVADPNTLAVISQPWQLQNINIHQESQGSRLIYNTILIVLVLVQDFFYLGMLNGLYAEFNIYARLYPVRCIIFRSVISAAYTFIGALCTTGMIYAFRFYPQFQTPQQFVLSWMVVWLFAHLNFTTFDVFTVWLPPKYHPMSLITWVVLNVTAVLIPFELSSPFYRVGYVMPAHELLVTLMDIWSGGCFPSLRYSLPILFALEISSFILSALGVYKRSHFAVLAEERKEREFKERIDTALAVEKKRHPKEHLDDKSPESDEIEKKDSERDELEKAEKAEKAREEAEDEEGDARMKVNPMSFQIFNLEPTRSRLERSKTAVIMP